MKPRRGGALSLSARHGTPQRSMSRAGALSVAGGRAKALRFLKRRKAAADPRRDPRKSTMQGGQSLIEAFSVFQPRVLIPLFIGTGVVIAITDLHHVVRSVESEWFDWAYTVPLFATIAPASSPL